MCREKVDWSASPAVRQSCRNGPGNTPDHAFPYATVNKLSLVPGGPELLFVFVDRYRLQIFSFDDQTAVETFDIIDAVTPGDDFGAAVLTCELDGLHKAN